MQQRMRANVVIARSWKALLFALLLLLVTCRGLQAQVGTDSGANSNLPVLLLVLQHPSGAVVQRDDLNIALKSTLRDALAASGRYQVHSFLPNESIIKRALNEHVIAADDLMEPYKSEALQRIAKAVGARYILTYYATLDHNEMRTDMRYHENPNVADWIVRADDHVAVPMTMGRKRLKQDDMVRLTVDSILSRLGIVSHLAANLPSLESSRTIYQPKSDKPKKGGSQKSASPKTDNVAGIPDSGTGSTGALNPGATVTKNGKEAPNPTAPPKGKTTKPDRNTRIANGVKPDRNPPDATIPRNDIPHPPTFTNEADPGHVSLPAQPTIAPPPSISRPDYEAQAARYRQTGDLASTVSSLRRAINERPHDISLRRQLIMTYQAKKMPEAAHAEALRALQLEPNNTALYRLYGEILLAQGDINGAMQAFREGTRIDPNDIGNQVALGDALLADKKPQEAFSAYEMASKSDAKSPLPHRRMARALAAKAETELSQYGASLAEIQTARTLTPATDTLSYLDDYVGLMQITEARIRGMLDELQAAKQARVQGKRASNDLLRQAADMKQRSEALADYLDKLPAAAGQDVTQAHYRQSNALFLEALGFFRELVNKADDRLADAMKSGQVQSERELMTAGQRLSSARTAIESADNSPASSEKASDK